MQYRCNTERGLAPGLLVTFVVVSDGDGWHPIAAGPTPNTATSTSHGTKESLQSHSRSTGTLHLTPSTAHHTVYVPTRPIWVATNRPSPHMVCATRAGIRVVLLVVFASPGNGMPAAAAAGSPIRPSPSTNIGDATIRWATCAQRVPRRGAIDQATPCCRHCCLPC